MKTVRFPKSICEAINKANRCFLWGSRTDKKKSHLVAWKETTKLRENGGLGIHRMDLLNQAFLASCVGTF